MEWKETRGKRGRFPRTFSVRPELRELEGCVLGNLNRPQLSYVLRIVVGNSEMDPNSAIWIGQCMEIRMEGNLGHEMEVSLEIFSQIWARGSGRVDG